MFKPNVEPTDDEGGMRIRGQSPYRSSGPTLGSSRPAMPATDASRQTNVYGSTTLPRPNSTANSQPTSNPALPNTNGTRPAGVPNNDPNRNWSTAAPSANTDTTSRATAPGTNRMSATEAQLIQYSGQGTYSTAQAPQNPTYAGSPPPVYPAQSYPSQTYGSPVGQPTTGNFTASPQQNYGQPVDPNGLNRYQNGTSPSDAIIGAPQPGQFSNGYPSGSYSAPGMYAPGPTIGGDYGTAVAPGAYAQPGTLGSPVAPGVIGIDPSSEISTPYQPPERTTPLIVHLQEARTGKVMIGGSVNSDLGLSGQLVIDERNFDIRRVPRSWDDVWSGKAFRGEGQAFRAELMPGTMVQRYTVNWTQRNLFGYLPYSLSVGGFLYTRQFRDWTEQRLGGRAALGYEITQDLSISSELRLEDVKIFDPRVNNVDSLNRVLGSNDLYTGRIRLAHDTRDSPFMSTQGHLLELIYDQVFGEYDYPRGMINYNRYFLVTQRPDESGRHTLASSWKLGFSGADTPLFENFFAGGYSTLRGFRFRGASPVDNGVQVGGRFMFLGSLEYVFPITADEMLKGVAFVDYGTIEQDISLKSKNFRVAPGLGLRIAIPALGPAPLAFDFAVPVKKADGDQTQVFSFFMGLTR